MSPSPQKRQIAAIRGTHDILPRQARKWQRVEKIAQSLFELYGYREIRTPIFEATELFQKGTGETSDIVMKEMYTFVDKGGRSLTLRPEYTPSIARAIIEHRLHLQPDPLRFYFIGPMFRYDKPQKGRYRQFHQMDVEVFNDKDPAVDAEIVEMAARLLERVKVKGAEVLVNSVGCRACRPDYLKALRQDAEKHRKDFCADCRRKIDSNPLRIFDCKIAACREIALGLPKITDYLCEECREHFDQFRSYLDLYELSYKVEPFLVRGLDYYTKTTFEFVSTELGAQDAILGGGRYDDMMKDFGGPDICGIGFALGMERLLQLVPDEDSPEKFVYIAWMGDAAKKEAVLIARFLRLQGLECFIEYKSRGLGNQMGRANKFGAPWGVIIGEDEIKKQSYQLKNMATGEQKEVTREELLTAVRND
ncbi:MAG: histidine--tRNA ligase [Candidatus Aminicenantes bacterium]|nr:histidine--tRNA ligase [Candidatus Aminicenantes bacterium]